MSIVSPEGFYGAFSVMRKCIDKLEKGQEDGSYASLEKSQNSDRRSNDRRPGEEGRVFKVICLCEPQLGKRGLVPTMSSKETYQETLAMKDVLAYADGTHDIYELARVIEQPQEVVLKVVNQLLDADLLREIK